MKNWFWWLAAGVLSICAGICALINPTIASLTVEQFVGWSFLLLGILQIICVFQVNGVSSKIWTIVAGAISIFVGFVLIAKPLAGMISLTMMVAILMFTLGVTKIFMSMSLKGTGYLFLVLISGVLSIMLSAMIFNNFPKSAEVMLGALLGVELISNGVILFVLSLSYRFNGDNDDALAIES